MLKFKLVSLKDYSNVLYEKEVKRDLLYLDKVNEIIEFLLSIKDEVIGVIKEPTKFMFFNDDEIVYTAKSDFMENFFRDEPALYDGLLSELYGVIYFVAPADLEHKEPKIVFTDLILNELKKAIPGVDWSAKVDIPKDNASIGKEHEVLDFRLENVNVVNTIAGKDIVVADIEASIRVNKQGE